MPRSFRILICSICLLAVAAAQPAKRRVAVMNFDYATWCEAGAAAIFGSNQDVGKGITDLLVDKLVADGAYTVIEREKLDKVLGGAELLQQQPRRYLDRCEDRPRPRRRCNHHRETSPSSAATIRIKISAASSGRWESTASAT